MFQADTFQIRTVREADLPEFQQHIANIANRGDYYPRTIYAEQGIRETYERDGFWSKDHGLLLIFNEAGSMIGQIEFFKPVSYWNAYEIAYLLYEPAERGKGIVTEATRILTRYLFENKLVNRIHLCIHADNIASQRVAEKCGYVYEGAVRGVWFNLGKHHDLGMYSILREDVID